MQKLGWLVFCLAALTAVYAYRENSEQNRLSALKMQVQSAQIATLKASMESRQENHAEALAAEERKLVALQHQLVGAKTALEVAQTQLADAKEQISVDSRMPTARDDLTDGKHTLKTLQEQLAAVDKQLADLQLQQKTDGRETGLARGKVEHDYETQIQNRKDEEVRLRALLATITGKGPDVTAERARVKALITEQEQGERTLREQKQFVMRAWADQQTQGKFSFASQRDALRGEKAQLQQQYEAAKAQYQDAVTDTDAHDARVTTDQGATKALQDVVQSRQRVVEQLGSDINAQLSVINTLKAH